VRPPSLCEVHHVILFPLPRHLPPHEKCHTSAAPFPPPIPLPLPSFTPPSARPAPPPPARNKAEREALLAAEESSLPSKPKSALKAGAKKKPPSDIPKATGAGLAGFGLDDPMGLRTAKGEDGEVVEGGELSATGVQGMLEAMEIVNQRTDRETLGAKVRDGVTRCTLAGGADVDVGWVVG